MEVFLRDYLILPHPVGWRSGATGLRVQLLVEAPLRNDSVQVVHTFVMPSSVFGTGQWAVTPCAWEGNRGSGIALAMRHRPAV